MPPSRMRLSTSPTELRPTRPGWPDGLAGLDSPPDRLRVAGALPPLEHAVAIVGTRRADLDARRFARRLAFDLARSGVTVVSGGALGIDAAAHEGAIEGGGATIAVLASGLEVPYPRRHGPLFERIVRERGALLTEAEDDDVPFRSTFLRRNRLIAGLSRVVVVIQAPLRSGALSTAAHARRLGRPVLAAPAAPWDLRSEGSTSLIVQGAPICTRAEDVLRVAAFGSVKLLPNFSLEDKKTNDLRDLDEDSRTALAGLGSQPQHVDQLSQEVGIPAKRLQRALLLLTLSGWVEERGPGLWIRARSSPRP